jgi:predicted component of type VI protein secretion system
MLKALVAKALKGDARAANVVLTLVGKLFEPEAVAERVPALTADDQAILELSRAASGRIGDVDHFGRCRSAPATHFLE